MTVYVKYNNIKPSSCGDCTLEYNNRCSVNGKNVNVFITNERHPDCQLIEIPDDGIITGKTCGTCNYYGFRYGEPTQTCNYNHGKYNNGGYCEEDFYCYNWRKRDVD